MFLHAVLSFFDVVFLGGSYGSWPYVFFFLLPRTHGEIGSWSNLTENALLRNRGVRSS